MVGILNSLTKEFGLKNIAYRHAYLVQCKRLARF